MRSEASLESSPRRTKRGGARRQPGQRSMQTRRDGARNERRTGRGDSRALKEQGADPDPFPAGLKGAGPLRRLAVAHPSLRAFAPLGPRSVWLRRPRIGVLPAVRLGVVLPSSRPLSFSPPVRLLSVFAPLSWLASLARWFVPLPLSSFVVLSVVLSVCVPRPVRRLLRIPVPRLRRAPGVPSRRPLRVLPVIVTSSRAPLRDRPAPRPSLDCVVPASRPCPPTASCSHPIASVPIPGRPSREPLRRLGAHRHDQIGIPPKACRSEGSTVDHGTRTALRCACSASHGSSPPGRRSVPRSASGSPCDSARTRDNIAAVPRGGP